MDIDFGPGDYKAEWLDRTPSHGELDSSDSGGCPRCGGPLTVEIPEPDVGHLGGTFCENILDTDDSMYCMWPDEPSPIAAWIDNS